MAWSPGPPRFRTVKTVCSRCLVRIPCRCLESTQSDFIEFSNFNVLLRDRKMPRLCGAGSYYFVQSDAGFFRVTFKSNDIFDGTGFVGQYEFRQRQEGNITRLES